MTTTTVASRFERRTPA